MTAIVGIDPSLRATGLARLTLHPAAAELNAVRPGAVVDTWRTQTTGHRDDPLAVRGVRIRDITADVIQFAVPCALAVIEGPSLGSPISGAAFDRAGLWWRIVGSLLRGGIPVAVVPPAVRACWATGNGRADKPAVRAAITRLWGHQVTDHNEADALVLASMGAQWLEQLPVPGPDPKILDSAAWPAREAIDA